MEANWASNGKQIACTQVKNKNKEQEQKKKAHLLNDWVTFLA
jgi:hypothetical protein